jgi:hypothetical protein
MTQLELLPGGKEPPHVPRVVCGSILQHPRWPEFSLWLKAEPRGTTKSWRVEFRSPPAGAAEWLLKIRVRCAACGAETSPVRTRKQPENKRHETVGHGLFLAVTCPVSVNAGCCRGKAVKEEFARILDAHLGACGCRKKSPTVWQSVGPVTVPARIINRALSTGGSGTRRTFGSTAISTRARWLTRSPASPGRWGLERH